MKITDSVKIGGITYKVETVNECCENNNNVDGKIIYDKQLIRLKHNNNTDYAKMVFLHEIVHALFDHCNIEQEENVVDRLSKALYMAFKDNPEVFIDYKEDYYKEKIQ